MAWTDQCKIQAVHHVDKKIEDGLLVRDALKFVSEESDIPVSTLNRWKYPRKEAVVITDHNGKATYNHKPEYFWKQVAKKTNSVARYIEDSCNMDTELPEEILESLKDSVGDITTYINHVTGGAR